MTACQFSSGEKDFENIFQENDLNIVIKCNLKMVNYLDAPLNLLNNTYKPFSKPNNEINYIHKESNHPPSTIKKNTFFDRVTFIKCFLK